MNCPTCNEPMAEGWLNVRAQNWARVLFTPAGLNDGFVQHMIGGSLLDNRLRPGEAEISRQTYWNDVKTRKRTLRCPACGMILIPGQPE